ncbi:MAG TPA: PaaI family thioesterase, partial [Acidimicrobiales bacterium]|nr:PaaI family thioesterase [Acidimicrobiales bacterium]
MTDPQPGSFDPDEVTDRLQLSPLHRFLGFRAVHIDTETCVLEMPIAPDAFGGTGNLHGGALATLIDVTSAMAAARANPFDFETHSLVTADLHVRYLGRPSGGDAVRAEARIVRAGRMLIVVETRVLDVND